MKYSFYKKSGRKDDKKKIDSHQGVLLSIKQKIVLSIGVESYIKMRKGQSNNSAFNYISHNN